MRPFSHLKEDYRAHRRALIAQGFWALQIFRFGSWARQIRSPILRFPLICLHILPSKFSEVFFGIYLGAHASIGRRFVIEHFGEIIVHSETVIGDDVRIRQGVTIGNRSHEQPLAVPRIGSRVNVGAGAKILGPIVIGDDVEIGANAVVVRDVPSWSVAVGVPARIIPKRAVGAARDGTLDGRASPLI